MSVRWRTGYRCAGKEPRLGYSAIGDGRRLASWPGKWWTSRPPRRTLSGDGNQAINESESTVYNSFGEVDYTIDFNGAKVDSIYDYEPGSGLATKFGRLARLDLYEPQGAKVEAVEYRYDELGRIDTVTETKGLEVRETDTDYDDQGRTVRIASPEGEIFYAYDEVKGRQSKMETANTAVEYGYDVLGRMVSVSETRRGGADLGFQGGQQCTSGSR